MQHRWAGEKHVACHAEYVAPPSVAGAVASAKVRLSNGTVVVAPMTLVSQWQSEIERYAPWLSVVTLHASDYPSLDIITSADVVIVSTWLLQKSSGKRPKSYSKAKSAASSSHARMTRVLSVLKRTHWHRVLVDESHYNQSSAKMDNTALCAPIKQPGGFLTTLNTHCRSGK